MVTSYHLGTRVVCVVVSSSIQPSTAQHYGIILTYGISSTVSSVVYSETRHEVRCVYYVVGGSEVPGTMY